MNDIEIYPANRVSARIGHLVRVGARRRPPAASSPGPASASPAPANAATKDAILLITLSPGLYTVQINPVGSGGFAIVEVYEVP